MTNEIKNNLTYYKQKLLINKIEKIINDYEYFKYITEIKNKCLKYNLDFINQLKNNYIHIKNQIYINRYVNICFENKHYKYDKLTNIINIKT